MGAPRRVLQPWVLAVVIGLGISACGGSAPSKPAPVSLPAAVSKTEQIATGRVTETLSASQGGQSLTLSYRYTFDTPQKLLAATVDYRNIIANQPAALKVAKLSDSASSSSSTAITRRSYTGDGRRFSRRSSRSSCRRACRQGMDEDGRRSVAEDPGRAARICRAKPVDRGPARRRVAAASPRCGFDSSSEPRWHRASRGHCDDALSHHHRRHDVARAPSASSSRSSRRLPARDGRPRYGWMAAHGAPSPGPRRPRSRRRETPHT